MGANQTKNNFSFGSYQHGTRPGYHITKTHIYYAGRVLKNIVPTNFTKLRAGWAKTCLLYTSPSPRDLMRSRMPSSA